MNDAIPESIKELVEHNDGLRKIYRMNVVGDIVGKPLLSEIAKKFDVYVNVLFGNITELQGIPFGNIIVEFSGSDKEINRAIMYINQKNVAIKGSEITC